MKPLRRPLRKQIINLGTFISGTYLFMVSVLCFDISLLFSVLNQISENG